jgi:hypothetical protein
MRSSLTTVAIVSSKLVLGILQIEMEMEIEGPGKEVSVRKAQ